MTGIIVEASLLNFQIITALYRTSTTPFLEDKRLLNLRSRLKPVVFERCSGVSSAHSPKSLTGVSSSDE
jgi:hypothetical protein